MVLALLADVEGLDRAEVAHDARPHLAGLRLGIRVGGRALVAGEVLAGQVAVDRADREGRRDRDVGDLEGRQRAAHHLLAGLARGDTLTHVQVQDRAARVLTLQDLLILEGLERVIRVRDRQLRGVRVVRLLGRARLDDVGEALAILLREAVRRALRGGGLQVVHVARGLLELDHALAHAVQDAHAHVEAARVRQVVGVVTEVAHHLVHAVDADRREVVIERAQVALRVGEEAVVHVVLDRLALDLEGLRGQVDELVHARDEALLVPLVQVAEARHVERDHADRAGQLRGAEEAVAALEELAQVQLQAAAHRADHVRVQVGVNEVLEVGQAVLRRHVEEGADVLTFPVKVGRDVVRRDREREDTAVRVATRHDLDERAVNEVHFPLQLAVGEVDDLVADEGVFVREVVRARPVEGQVREGALAAPARGHVQVVDELLHALHDLLVLHVVQSHEGGHVGVEGGERLGARPLVLEGSEEVDDLAAGRGEMLGRGRGDRATHAIEALLDEALERPARAVSGEHVEVVDVVVALTVRGADLGRVDVLKPVVGDDLARRIQDQATQRIPLVRVGVDSPIGAIEVLLDCCNSVDVVSGCGHCSGPVLIPLFRCEHGVSIHCRRLREPLALPLLRWAAEPAVLFGRVIDTS